MGIVSDLKPRCLEFLRTASHNRPPFPPPKKKSLSVFMGQPEHTRTQKNLHLLKRILVFLFPFLEGINSSLLKQNITDYFFFLGPKPNGRESPCAMQVDVHLPSGDNCSVAASPETPISELKAAAQKHFQRRCFPRIRSPFCFCFAFLVGPFVFHSPGKIYIYIYIYLLGS